MELKIGDLVTLMGLAALVPLLVHVYLKRPQFQPGIQLLAILGGLLWIGFAFLAELFSRKLLSLGVWDAVGHNYWGQRLAESMAMGDWGPFFNHFRFGNRAYQCYVALVYWIGGSVYTVMMINGILCFWGGLMLARYFGSISPPFGKSMSWILAVIFFPSVVFWGTMNLKEGPMYWSICCLLSSTFVTRWEEAPLASPLGLAGIAVGGLLRPHVILGWVVAVTAVNIFQRGRRGLALVLVLILPLLFAASVFHSGAGLSTESTMDVIETRYHGLYATDQGSRINYLFGRPIPLVSGFISAMFRPFPWQIRSTRVLLSCIETWVMTLILAVVWFKYGRTFGRMSLKLPSVRAAILGSMWICLLLSYFPNEGLVVRQRVQMIPGLLTLAAVPLLLRETVRQRLEYRRRVLKNILRLE